MDEDALDAAVGFVALEELLECLRCFFRFFLEPFTVSTAFFTTFLTSCNCENQLAVEEVAACENVMDGMAFPENEEACDSCCIAEGFEQGAPFGTVSEASNQKCDCGDVGTCDD